MKLNENSSAAEIFEEFPMLAECGRFDLAMMQGDLAEDEGSPYEDKALYQAIDILFKRVKDGTYSPPGVDEDDYLDETAVPA